MTFGLNMSVPKMRKLHPADDLFAWLVIQISKMRPINAEKISFVEIKEKLHELYLGGYEEGYQQGSEEEHGESRRPLEK